MVNKLLIIVTLCSLIHARKIMINTAMSTIIELRSNYYSCRYDEQDNIVICNKNQSAPSDLPLTITFDHKDALHVECSLKSHSDLQLVGTYRNERNVCAIWIKSATNTAQNTAQEWRSESYEEE